jgi:hypothetical protein
MQNHEDEIEILENLNRHINTKKALRLAIETLKKQIPKIPIIEHGEYSPALCPSCKEELSKHLGDGYYEHRYMLRICECGQKIKWDEEQEEV